MASFDWRARLTWIGRTDSGVVRQRLYDRKIMGLGLSVLDPNAKVWAAAIRQEPGFVFWYTDPHWFGLAGDGSALKYRQLIDAQMADLAKPDEMLMLDLEQVSKEYVRRLLNGSAGNRGLVGSNNPGNPVGTQADRPLAYTNEPFKDGTVVPIADIYEAGLHFYPQLYYGPMTPADPAAVVLDLARWLGEVDVVDPSGEVVHPFYDGKLFASDQRDGAWFTAERMPGVFSLASALRTFLQTDTTSKSVAIGMTKDSLRAYYTQLARAA